MGLGPTMATLHMAHARRAPLLIRLALPVVLAAGGFAAEPNARPILEVDSPPGSRIENGVGIYPNGFVARYADLVLLGDMLRWDIRREDVWAEGRVVLVRPGIRIHAARLGLHLQAQSGEAWDVEAWIDGPTGRIPVHAEHVRLDRHSVVFEGVGSRRRHGGILAVGARRLTVRLRETVDPERKDAGRFVRDVALTGPWFALFDVPVFWLPYLYRDLSFDYPWTRLDFGNSSRLGRYIRFELGTGLPEVGGWKTRVIGQADRFTATGTGFGAGLDWRHSIWGQGLAKWYAMEPEHVTDSAGNALGDRHQRVIDAEQRAAFPGGALSARWVELPHPDAGAPLERFRTDYLREDLHTRPFARRGITAAWGLPLGTLVADVEQAPRGDAQTSDRDFGLQARLADLRLIGPLHAIGDAWLERVRNDQSNSEVTRINAEAGLRALSWFGGLGVDAGAGARGLLYADGTLGGVEQQDDPWRAAPYADAGVRLRLANRFTGGLFHVITPRVGLEVIGEGYHDALPVYGFVDRRSRLVEDRRYLVTSLDTSVTRGRELFHADVLARWALRDADRRAVDDTGLTRSGSTALAQVEAVAVGRPTATFTIDADLLYDARLEQWQYFDTGAKWDALMRASLLYTASYNPVPGLIDRWEHRPGVELRGNRYTLNSDLSMRPGGADLDGIAVQLLRRAVDAQVSLTFAFVRDQNGNAYDRRWGVGITFP